MQQLYNPLVSIIIPTYNRAHLIGETLDSVLAQTYPNWECIIVDDGSTDNTDEIVEGYLKRDTRFKYHYRPKDRLKGGNAARNYGFVVSKGEYINWLDSDDILFNEAMELKINSLIAEQDSEALIARNNYSNYSMTTFRDSKFQIVRTLSFLLFLYGTDQIELQTTVFLWKRSFLENKSLFDETMQRFQDNEFHIRMLSKLKKITMIDNVLATVRSGNGHETQISAITNLNTEKLLDIFRYRYLSLQLVDKIPEEQEKLYTNIVSKKTIWSFYLALKSIPNGKNRIKTLIAYRNKVNEVLCLKETFWFNRLKSYLYLLKIVIFK
jgi:glycosyltransferase involved in cell wall biosynthesis